MRKKAIKDEQEAKAKAIDRQGMSYEDWYAKNKHKKLPGLKQ